LFLTNFFSIYPLQFSNLVGSRQRPCTKWWRNLATVDGRISR
jgi:hypothetical protein